MAGEREEVGLNLQKTIVDAKSRIDRKLGVPAHETTVQVERVSKSLYTLGAIEPRLVVENGTISYQPVITFGAVAEGFVGSIRNDGVMRFGPKRVTDQGIALDLDESRMVHQIPGIGENEVWRTTFEWGQRAMAAVTEIAETYLAKLTATPANDDSDDGRVIRLEMGVQHDVAPK